MNNDFNLDDFKEDFKSFSTPKKEAVSIQKMLNKSSIDNAKYILIISIVEFIIALILYVLEFSMDGSNDEIISQLPAKGLEQVNNISLGFRITYTIFLVVSFSFIITFYKIYKNLRTDQTIKSFTNDIIKFRQKANYFIAYNVAAFILFWVSFTVMVVEITKFIVDKNNIPMMEHYTRNIYIAFFVIFLFAISLIFIYYRYFWGMFLGRLKRNQKELQELDE